MLSRLYLYNFPSGTSPEAEFQNTGAFFMKTCQRTLVLAPQNTIIRGDYAYDFVEAEQAYAYLLEIICGLKSKLVGENEIVSQFKQAYKAYCLQKDKDSLIMTVLQKLLQDSKDIRTKYLIGIAQKTYSSLARRILLSQHKASEVIILGSGQLAEDMINQVKKKVPVTLIARNQERIQELVDKHQIQSACWSQVADQNFHFVNDNAFIVNTIGTENEILTPLFFEKWLGHSQRCFVDLASPSPYKTAPIDSDGFYQLEDIFQLGAVKEQKKSKQIEKAKDYLDQVVEKRANVLRNKLMAMQTKLMTYGLSE